MGKRLLVPVEIFPSGLTDSSTKRNKTPSSPTWFVSAATLVNNRILYSQNTATQTTEIDKPAKTGPGRFAFELHAEKALGQKRMAALFLRIGAGYMQQQYSVRHVSDSTQSYLESTGADGNKIATPVFRSTDVSFRQKQFYTTLGVHFLFPLHTKSRFYARLGSDAFYLLHQSGTFPKTSTRLNYSFTLGLPFKAIEKPSYAIMLEPLVQYRMCPVVWETAGIKQRTIQVGLRATVGF